MAERKLASWPAFSLIVNLAVPGLFSLFLLFLPMWSVPGAFTDTLITTALLSFFYGEPHGQGPRLLERVLRPTPVPVVPSPKFQLYETTDPSTSDDEEAFKETGFPATGCAEPILNTAVGATSLAVKAKFWVCHCDEWLGATGPLTWLLPHSRRRWLDRRWRPSSRPSDRTPTVEPAWLGHEKSASIALELASRLQPQGPEHYRFSPAVTSEAPRRSAS